MTTRLLLSALCLMGLVACHSPHSYPGDVTFLWTFAGSACADTSVDTVHIDIAGEALANNGDYPCTLGGVDGVTLHDFAAGIYDYDIQAFDDTNTELYEVANSFDVNGSIEVDVDLTPPGVPPSYAFLSWDFPGNVDCATAGVAQVTVDIDGTPTAPYACTDGLAPAQVGSDYVTPGTHAFDLIAQDGDGNTVFTGGGNLHTVVGSPVAATFDLR